MLFKNTIIALMPVVLLATSCSDSISEKQASNAPEKVFKVKNSVPSCCSKIPSRFSAKPKL